MVLANDQEVTHWVDVLEEAYSAAHNEGMVTWDSLAERVSAASDVSCEAFVREVGDSGQGVELVAGIVAEKSRFPGLYWELVTPDPWGWVTTEQRTELTRLWGDGWAEHLPAQLAHRWGAGWEQHPDEHKVAWLTPLIEEFAAQQPEPTAASAQAAASEPAAADPVSAAVIGAVAAVPGAEQLSEEDMVVVMAQVRARMEGTTK